MRSRLLARLSIVATLGTLVHAAVSPETAALPSAQLVARADTLLRSGQGSQALELYDLVVERDASDYLVLYKRATTYAALSQTRRALEDFQAVLKLSDFEQARVEVARIHLKSGAFDDAKAEVDALLKANKKHAAGTALRTTITETAKHVAEAKKAANSKKWEACIAAATSALEHAPNSGELRDLRANCRLAVGQIDEAVGDLSRSVALNPSAEQTLLRLARLNYFYIAEDSARGLQPIQQCLKYDPDSKPCKTAFRLFRAIDKDRSRVRNYMEGSQWRMAADALLGKTSLLERVREAIKAAVAEGEPDISRANLLSQVLHDSCKAQLRAGSVKAAAPICEELLTRDPTDLDGLIGRGEDLMRREEYEEAVRVLTDAFEKSGRSSQDILDRVRKAQGLLKRSKAKDYYKVLGVSKDADERTIKKAYRRLTIKYHPDKQGGSEKKMAELNEAYEVLSKPELKARYDAGDDPNDPQAQQGGNPFAHHGGTQFFFQQSGQGGNPFANMFQQQGGGFRQGGGGQHFEFRFG